jgi:hypothetical protein
MGKRSIWLLGCFTLVVSALSIKGQPAEEKPARVRLFPFHEGGKEGKWGCINSQGKVVANGAKQQAPPIAAFRDQNSGKYGFINRWGAVVLEPQYDYAADFVDGLARVDVGGRLGFIEPSGKLKFTLPPGTKGVFYASEGRVWFLSPKEERWGLCDAEGRVILEPTYDNVEAFAEGRAAVNVGAKWRFPGIQVGGKWGYVNKKGELVVPVQYQFVGRFSDGLARVSDSAGTKFIDKSGKAVIDLIDLGKSSTGEFREGLAPVYIDRSLAGKNWLTRFIDRQGKSVLSVDGWAEEFHEGMAAIGVRGGEAKSNANTSYGYIDREGKVVIGPRFAEAQPFSQGLAAVRTKKTTVWGRGDAWGYIDKTGKYRIEPLFNEARPFLGGVARVHIGGTLHVVHDAPPFWEGGEWWLIDTKGKKLRRSH